MGITYQHAAGFFYKQQKIFYKKMLFGNCHFFNPGTINLVFFTTTNEQRLFTNRFIINLQKRRKIFLLIFHFIKK